MKIKNLLICDDVRNEVGNKHSFMGVYEDVINININEKQKDKKVQLPLTIYVNIVTEEKKDEEFDIESIQLDVKINNKIFKTIKFPFKAKVKKSLSLVMKDNFAFDESGDLSFYLALSNKKEVLETFEIHDTHKIKINFIDTESVYN